MKRMESIAFCAALLAGIATAQAVSHTIYFGEDDSSGAYPMSSHPNADQASLDFQDRLSGAGTENFESMSTGGFSSLSLDFGYATATLSGGGTIRSSSNVGRWATSGSRYLESNCTPTSGFSVDFGQQTAAFGFYGTDFGDFDGQIVLTLSGGVTTQITVPNSVPAGDGSCLFFGVVAEDSDSTFTSITFRSTVSNDFFGFDDMTIGTLQQVVPSNVPEPLTMLALGGSLAGLGGYVRRRRKA